MTYQVLDHSLEILVVSVSNDLKMQVVILKIKISIAKFVSQIFHVVVLSSIDIYSLEA